MTHSVSTIGCLQLVLSTQTLKFKVILDQQVHDQMTHLNKKYKRLTSDYQELCQVVMEMRSNMSDRWALSYCPTVPATTNLVLFVLQRHLCFRFIVFERINILFLIYFYIFDFNLFSTSIQYIFFKKIILKYYRQ